MASVDIDLGPGICRKDVYCLREHGIAISLADFRETVSQSNCIWFKDNDGITRSDACRYFSDPGNVRILARKSACGILSTIAAGNVVGNECCCCILRLCRCDRLAYVTLDVSIPSTEPDAGR